jgi:hypothetical protein
MATIVHLVRRAAQHAIMQPLRRNARHVRLDTVNCPPNFIIAQRVHPIAMRARVRQIAPHVPPDTLCCQREIAKHARLAVPLAAQGCIGVIITRYYVLSAAQGMCYILVAASNVEQIVRNALTSMVLCQQCQHGLLV